MNLDRLFDARVRIVTGKGGVGKSSVAMAMAVVAARNGRRVLVAEVNAPESMARIIGQPPLTGVPRQILPNVFGVGLIPDEAIEEYALMVLKFRALYTAVFENRLTRYFLHAVPSLAEFVMLGKLWFHEVERIGQRPAYDTIIVDAPSTGHLVSWLRVPQVFEEMMPLGPLKKSAGDMREMLEDPLRTRLDIVTLAEEMPVNEAVEIDHACRQFNFATRGLTIINRLLEPLPPELLAKLGAQPLPATLLPLRRALEKREHWRTMGEGYLHRLPQGDFERAVRLPRLPTPVGDPDSLKNLAQQLARALEVH